MCGFAVYSAVGAALWGGSVMGIRKTGDRRSIVSGASGVMIVALAATRPPPFWLLLAAAAMAV
jgi:hypothetical protein